MKLSTVALKLAGTTYKDGNAGMSKAAITNGYRFTYTPQSALEDGAKKQLKSMHQIMMVMLRIKLRHRIQLIRYLRHLRSANLQAD